MVAQFVIGMCLLHLRLATGVELHHQKSNVGQEFYFGILKPYNPSTTIQLIVTSNSNTSGTFTVSIPYLGVHSTRTIHNGMSTIGVSNRIIPVHSDRVEDKGIKVAATVDIALAVAVTPGNMNEGALVYPVESLSTKYIIASYAIFDIRWHSEFLIVAVYDGTTIKFSRRQDNIKENGTFVIHLDAQQTYFYQSTKDLSGSILQSDKPVAVFSGSEAAEVPSGFNGGEFLVEQMPPTDTLGHYFIVPNLPPKTKYAIRIFAKDANSTITYHNSTFTVSEHKVEAGEYVEVQTETEPMVVHGTKPLMVTVYAASRTYTKEFYGDPFMSIVPAINQYMNEYNFAVSTIYAHFDHFLVVIVENDKRTGLFLNGSPLKDDVSSSTVTVNHIPYLVRIYRIQSASSKYRLYHSAGTTFGAMLYGFIGYTQDDHQAYGYPLGMAFNKNNPLQNASQPDGNMCFSCQDMTHLYLCDTVTRCKYTEQCYIERYTGRSGEVKYNSGCRGIANCASAGHTVGRRSAECAECCSEDYCNSQGCGGTGLPPRNSRGPLCFDCAYVSTMDECKTIRLCRQNETCSIEMFVWGGIYNHFTTKCHSNQCVLSSKRDFGSNKHRRSTPDCHTCCHDDFCNSKCSLSPPDIIVG